VSEGPRGEDARTAAPEGVVVEHPLPEPNYPRYRAKPAEHLSLADVDPNESEHYRKKKDVLKELEAQRRRIRDLQERLYAENQQGLLVVLQAMDTGGKKESGRCWSSTTSSTCWGRPPRCPA
jgi:polyphosphate kinase 2 (PPK2 family)